MATPYGAAASEVLNSIVTNLGGGNASEAAQEAIRQALAQVPRTNDPGGQTVEVQVYTESDNAPAEGDVVNVIVEKVMDASRVQSAQVVVVNGGGTLQGHMDSGQSQTIAMGGNGNANIAVTGTGEKTIVGGGGKVTANVTTTDDVKFIAGQGEFNANVIGNSNTTIDTTNATTGSISTGAGNDSAKLGRDASFNLNLGGGHNKVSTAAATSSSGTSGFVPANSQDGYKLSVDDHNRIILDDGRGHVSTLANVNVVEFSNGSTFVKASTVDEAIIARMYEAVLNRTADANGIYNWWDAYNSGQLSLQQVGSSFLNSEEAQIKGFGSSVDNSTFVTNLYHNLMDREPDAEGLLNWTNALNSGTLTRSDVLLSFTASAEGAANNTGTVLLSTVSGAGQDYTPHTFNVVPDGSQTVAGGAGFDVVNFAGKKADFVTTVDIDRVTVFNAATNSATTIDHAEYIKFGDGSVMINAANADQAVIARMYDAVLNRDADADGLHNWWAAHDNGMSLTDIAHSFLTSPEFQAQSSNLSDTAFVSLMYQNMFGRAPDQGGLENFTNALSHGMSREDVVVNIAKSLEGANHSSDTIKIIDHTHSY